MAALLTRIVHGLHFKNLRGDFFGGLTAAIVALPLALAFGVSSGQDLRRAFMEQYASDFLLRCLEGPPLRFLGLQGQ